VSIKVVCRVPATPDGKTRAIALMMEAERTSETSVDIQLRTRQYIADDCELNMEYQYKKLYFLYI
jgi:hypothetical protein